MADLKIEESIDRPIDEKTARNTDVALASAEQQPDPAFEGALAVVRDGIKVFPPPTSDPLDPLNWTRLQKNTILGISMFLYFLFTYVTTTTVPTFVALQEQYNASYAQISWTIAIPALGLTVGPLIWSSFADIYGRRIIFIIGTIIALAATIAAALAPTFPGYMAARFFQGLGVSPGATVGLAAINDMFYEHERGQKVGLWVLAIDVGLLVGPITGGFAALLSTAWVQWLTAILLGFLLLLEIFFMPETLYPRRHMVARMPANQDIVHAAADLEKTRLSLSDDTVIDLKRTKKLSFFNFKPVPGMRHPTPWDSTARFIKTFKLPIIVLATLTYVFAWYWWMLSIITLLPAAYINYSPQIQGLLFIGLLLGTLFSELLFSGTLSDWLVLRNAKQHNGVRTPEMRLWLAYPAALLSAIGLIIWGISIDQGYHWIVGQIAFFLFAAGIQSGQTVIVAYMVDCYPLQSMSIITFYSVFLNLSAFIDPFFIGPWQLSSGFTWCFAAQGIITFFLSVPLIFVMHKFGPIIRAKSPHPTWYNPEFDRT